MLALTLWVLAYASTFSCDFGQLALAAESISRGLRALRIAACLLEAIAEHESFAVADLVFAMCRDASGDGPGWVGGDRKSDVERPFGIEHMQRLV